MLLAVLSVTVLIALTLGLRESGVVAIAIPVTLALTLLVIYLYGYTLNRVTLFALIFSIGILVDDAIVVVENIVRHFRMPENRGRPLVAGRRRGGGRSGQPDDPGHLRRDRRDPADGLRARPDGALHAARSPSAPRPPCSSRCSSPSSSRPGPRCGCSSAGRSRLGPGGAATRGGLDHAPLPPRDDAADPQAGAGGWRSSRSSSCCCLAAHARSCRSSACMVKMLPFDNKSEFQVIVDMPEGHDARADRRRDAGDRRLRRAPCPR